MSYHKRNIVLFLTEGFCTMENGHHWSITISTNRLNPTDANDSWRSAEAQTVSADISSVNAMSEAASLSPVHHHGIEGLIYRIMSGIKMTRSDVKAKLIRTARQSRINCLRKKMPAMLTKCGRDGQSKDQMIFSEDHGWWPRPNEAHPTSTAPCRNG